MILKIKITSKIILLLVLKEKKGVTINVIVLVETVQCILHSNFCLFFGTLLIQ